PRLAILNRDDSSYAYLSGVSTVHHVSYGVGSKADLVAENIHLSDTGSGFTAVGNAAAGAFRVDITTGLPGLYNISNCLAALGATVVGASVDPQIAARGLASALPVPGRMERIEAGQDFTAIVDFAHTPNALKAALEASRRVVTHSAKGGRVIAVFGSAGLRDRAKRRMMAEVAAANADFMVLTAEDPRTESLDLILNEMAEGARSKGGREGVTFWKVPDRGEAIRFAVGMARPGDLVIACGKGHEQSMCFGYKEHPWDDRTALRAALCERLGLPGPKMPYLPTRDQPEKDWIKLP
ncbi:MAG TPA: cyanophycin synthetase, partial [Anaerolineales bacterium]|nr:cyanophycin synthetase [Anaerolineales bacterium]